MKYAGMILAILMVLMFASNASAIHYYQLVSQQVVQTPVVLRSPYHPPLYTTQPVLYGTYIKWDLLFPNKPPIYVTRPVRKPCPILDSIF